jgi:hypothetical protein
MQDRTAQATNNVRVLIGRRRAERIRLDAVRLAHDYQALIDTHRLDPEVILGHSPVLDAWRKIR